MDGIGNAPDPAAPPGPPLDPATKAYLDNQLIGFKQNIFQQYQQQWSQAEAAHKDVQKQMEDQLKAAEEKEREYRNHIAVLEERLQQLEERESFER